MNRNSLNLPYIYRPKKKNVNYIESIDSEFFAKSGNFLFQIYNKKKQKKTFKNISKHLSVLRKLKYKLNRLNLEKLYLTFIRPLFEYGCEIWDNCGINNSENLEKLQREAARIVTGLCIIL